ncbi:MAG: ABC transporter permease [Rhodanobacteraceae bacterium]
MIVLFVLWTIAGLTLGHGNISHQTAGALSDPFGLRALDLLTRYWTPDDRNARVPALTGLLLGNRALWLGIAVILLGATVALFKPDRDGFRWFRRRRRAGAAGVPATSPAAAIVLPLVTLRSGFAVRCIQFRKLAWFDTKSVFSGAAFLVMLLIGFANLTAALSFTGQIYGTSVYPVTHLMASAMEGSYQWLLLIILAFYAGELVWRERGARTSEVIDAFPTPDWIPLLSKVAALAVVIVVFLAAGSLYSMGYQALHGFHHLQPLLYLKFIGLDLVDFLLFAIIAVVFQAWANNKFVGYALVVAYFIALIALGQLHFSGNLYLPGQHARHAVFGHGRVRHVLDRQVVVRRVLVLL